MRGRRTLRLKHVQIKRICDAWGARAESVCLLSLAPLLVVRSARIGIAQRLVRADNVLDTSCCSVFGAGLVGMMLPLVDSTHYASEAQVCRTNLCIARGRSDAQDGVRVVGRAHRRRRSGGLDVEAKKATTKRYAVRTCGSATGSAPRPCVPGRQPREPRLRSAHANREYRCDHPTSRHRANQRQTGRGRPRA